MKLRYFAAIMATVAVLATPASAERLVLLHTNDVHSNIEPDRKSGLGGALRRKAVIDSVRAAEPNVLLIDAGDAVQGSLYFNLFGGEVERKIMNALDYDMATVGNHEFDNGLEKLAANYRLMDAELLSSNYDFSGTPLDGLMLPYAIREVGGKKIGFIAVNVNPAQLIDDKNIEGVVYHDCIATANKLAHLLKTKEHCDKVVVISHIGFKAEGPDQYATDRNLAATSSDIDIIIGGHSHTLLAPGSADTSILNAEGRPVLVAQTGSRGANIGEIAIDLETGDIDYRLISVDSRLDDRLDADLGAVIDSYKTRVDSISSIPVGQTAKEMPSGSNTLLNMASDVVLAKGIELLGAPVDLSVMNKGGLRSSLPKGKVTRGDIMSVFPFDNRIVVLELTGAKLRELFDILSSRGGNGVSSTVDITMDRDTGKVTGVTIGGEPLDDNRTYRVATIDYLAKGNDYMTTFAGKPVLVRSNTPLFNTVIDYIAELGAQGKKLTSDDRPRMHY